MAITTNGKVSITNLQVGSSADLAGIISDESGTGVLAFTNSPTFTTPTLGTASATAIELGHATDTTISRVSAGVIAVEGNAVLVSGGALGTPSSATLTNATGLPISGITASTSSPIGVGTIELGHATDTTISRASAGVVAIEGVNVVTETATQTLSNKTLTSPVISTITNTGTLTLPTSTGTLALTTDIPAGVVTESATQTLTNKTLTSPTVGTQASFANQAEARFLEATANGTNYVGFKAPTAITTNQVWVLPSADGTASQSLVTDGAGNLSFASSGVSANDQSFAFAVQVFA